MFICEYKSIKSIHFIETVEDTIFIGNFFSQWCELPGGEDIVISPDGGSDGETHAVCDRFTGAGSETRSTGPVRRHGVPLRSRSLPRNHSS
jgi:hypothetical protein